MRHHVDSSEAPLRPALRPALCLAALVLLVASTSRAEQTQSEILWDDGKAEFAAYEVEWARYGRTYAGRALLVTVKEPWDATRDIKADGRSDFDVIKLNHQLDVTTGIYRYHRMASLFWRQNDGSLQKVQTTHQDACGMSTALWSDDRLETRSYFHGNVESDRISTSGRLTEDGLPWTLRAYVTGPLPNRLQLLPRLMDDRFDTWVAQEVELRRSEARNHDVPAGPFSAVELTISSDSRTLSFLFDEDPPHRLLEMEDGRGTRYRLAKVERLAYWQMASPEHATWWPENLR